MTSVTATATIEDARVISRIADRDGDAVEQFYRTHSDAVFWFVYRRLDGNHEDAEEVTQEVFLSAIKLAASYDGSCTAQTWLYGIAKLRVIDRLRKSSSMKRIPKAKTVALDDEAAQAVREYRDGHLSPEGVLDRMDAEALLDHMLAGLNDKEREALTLRYVDELTTKEISHVLGRSEKAVENLLARARNKARDAFLLMQAKRQESTNV